MRVALLKPGVHATLAGIILALLIPLKRDATGYSVLKSLEHDLHGTVAHFVLPVFAFAEAGISLANIGAEEALHSIPLGIALGLFFGKQIGIFVLCWIAIRLGLTKLAESKTYAS
jgi:NhaA family Na+:H+ antiporter